MKFDEYNYSGLRELFCNIVNKVFEDTNIFLDFIENEEYTWKYNCYYDYSGENYIINRRTGEYINWFKFTHIGRDINISAYPFITIDEVPEWIEKFLLDFKNY